MDYIIVNVSMILVQREMTKSVVYLFVIYFLGRFDSKYSDSFDQRVIGYIINPVEEIK